MISRRRQIRVGQHQPFRAGIFEIHLHARMRPAAFAVDDGAEAGAFDSLAETQRTGGRGFDETTAIGRSRYFLSIVTVALALPP